MVSRLDPYGLTLSSSVTAGGNGSGPDSIIAIFPLSPCLPSAIKYSRRVLSPRKSPECRPNGVAVSRPPRHLADLELAERRGGAPGAGGGGGRAGRRCTHLFSQAAPPP